MNLRAYKMDGLGNDFVIFDNRKKVTHLDKSEIIKIADRNFIGCDQLIFINKSNDYDAELDFYNSDGGNSTACGNGTRCIAYFISKEKNKEEIIFKTQSGVLKSKILGNNIVETNIGSPKFDKYINHINDKTKGEKIGICSTSSMDKNQVIIKMLLLSHCLSQKV